MNPPSRLQQTFRALRHRDFALFWSGQWISVTGTWMQSMALSWLIYRLTNSPLALGFLVVARLGPSMVGAPFAGVLADRFPRRPLVILTQATSLVLAALLATLTLGGHIQVWHILALSLAQGCVDTVDMTVRQTFQMDIVGPEDLQSAVSLNSAAFNAGRMVGPMLAGFALHFWSEGVCFVFNAVSYLAVLLSLFLIRSRPQVRKPATASVMEEIGEGLRYVWTTRILRDKILAIGVTAVVGLSFTTLLPALARDVLHAGSRGFGWLGSGSGVGAMIGALLAAAGSGKSPGRLTHVAGLMVMGLGLTALGFSRSLPLSVLLMTVIGLSIAIQLAGTNAFLQTSAPGRLRGRVISIYMWVFTGFTPIGGLAAGWAGQHLGVPRTAEAAGLLCLLAGLAFLQVDGRAGQKRSNALKK